MTCFFAATTLYAGCLWPQLPYIPDAAASDQVFAGAHQAVITYMRDLDQVMSCLNDEATELKPLQVKAAHDDYLSALVLMQQAVDQYNAALKAHTS